MMSTVLKEWLNAYSGRFDVSDFVTKRKGHAKQFNEVVRKKNDIGEANTIEWNGKY